MHTEPPTSPTTQTLVAAARRHGATIAPGTVAGTAVYLHTGRLWHALMLACLLGPPTKAIQRVAAQWIELLAPPRRWRRPRRRGS